MTLPETTAHFQLLNNAQSFLRATLQLKKTGGNKKQDLPLMHHHDASLPILSLIPENIKSSVSFLHHGSRLGKMNIRWIHNFSFLLFVIFCLAISQRRKINYINMMKAATYIGMSSLYQVLNYV